MLLRRYLLWLRKRPVWRLDNMKNDATRSPGRVLVIAGSDSGGGAGIQADIKTIYGLGGFPTTAVSALTAQNTHGVRDVLPIPADFVTAQIRAVLDDIGADCIKTGLLPTIGVIESVCAVLAEHAKEVRLVVDPVMVASSGDFLMEEAARDYMARHLIPLSDLCTPNMPEASFLSGRCVHTLEDMRQAAGDIIRMGARAVLVKGGHGDGPVVRDLLLTDKGETLFEDQRINRQNTHGTGCSLASAVAVGLAGGRDLKDAVDAARRFVRAGIRTAPMIGGGANRPLGHPLPGDGDAPGFAQSVDEE